MSKDYDFKYCPETGELPGKELERQTEQALNELGQTAYDAKETADNAKEASAEAGQMAGDALETAQNALTAANNAQQGVDGNAQNITTLQTNVGQNSQNIQSLQNGLSAANQNIAANSGNIGQNSELIAVMQNDVAQAASAAASANSLALSIEGLARNVFTIDENFRDANEFYTEGTKLYLTNEGEALNDDENPSANLNFPPELTPPIWFEVFITGDGSRITQTAWDDTSQHIFTRVGELIDNSDLENPVLTWTPWNSVAVPQTVKNVEVEVDPEGQSAGTYLIITFDTETGDLAVYINLTQLLPVYTAGNNGIVISSDYQVSLKLAENSGLEITGNGLGISPSAIRKRLTGDATYYMDAAAGSDGNDGATADKALQSFAGLSALLNSLDSAGHDITIQLAAGTYTNCKLTPDSPLGHKLIFKGQAFDVDNLQYGANLEDVDFYGVRAVFNDVGFTTTARAYFYRSHISFFGDIRVGSALQFSVFSSAEAGYIDPAGVRHLATFNVIKASLEWVVGVGNYSNFSGMSAGYPLGLVFYQNTSFSWGLFYISNSTIYTSNWVLPAPDYAITGNNSFVGIQFSGLFHGTVTTKEAFLANWPNKKATFTECTPGSAIVRFSNAVLPYKLGPALQTVDNTTPGFYVKVAGADGGMVTVPSGGSWLVKVSRRRVADDAAMYTTLGGIVAGGTSFTAGTGYTYDLECWRIE